MTTSNVKFSRVDSAKFFRTLNKRVNLYFKENNIKRTGNWKLHLKTIIMFSMFLTPYFLMLTHFAMVDVIVNHCYGSWHGWCWYECDA